MRNFDQGARSLPTERALHDWISPPYLEALSKTENGRGCTASSALPRPNGDEGSCLSKGWKFWTQDELRNARAKTHVNGQAHVGGVIIGGTFSKSPTIRHELLQGPCLTSAIGWNFRDRKSMQEGIHIQVATSAPPTNRLPHRFFWPRRSDR